MIAFAISTLAFAAPVKRFTGANADGKDENSPSIGSGNLVEAPVQLPVNVSDNAVGGIGGFDPAFGNESENH